MTSRTFFSSPESFISIHGIETCKRPFHNLGGLTVPLWYDQDEEKIVLSAFYFSALVVYFNFITLRFLIGVVFRLFVVFDFLTVCNVK